ncbi:MAG: hypothetical protein NTY59_14130 [Alphaproteobacteria bacterium]|nr:hypothetical protein [Alphaproteobacteria bacterium]
MTLARLVLVICLAVAGPAFAQTADDPARLEAGNRIYDRVFPDEASLIDYVLPYVPNDNPRAKSTASDIIRRLDPAWLHNAFVSSLALAYTLPELVAYERFLATPEGLAIWRKTPQFDRAFNQLLELRMKTIGAI